MRAVLASTVLTKGAGFEFGVLGSCETSATCSRVMNARRSVLLISVIAASLYDAGGVVAPELPNGCHFSGIVLGTGDTLTCRVTLERSIESDRGRQPTSRWHNDAKRKSGLKVREAPDFIE